MLIIKVNEIIINFNLFSSDLYLSVKNFYKNTFLYCVEIEVTNGIKEITCDATIGAAIVIKYFIIWRSGSIIQSTKIRIIAFLIVEKKIF